MVVAAPSRVEQTNTGGQGESRRSTNQKSLPSGNRAIVAVNHNGAYGVAVDSSVASMGNHHKRHITAGYDSRRSNSSDNSATSTLLQEGPTSASTTQGSTGGRLERATGQRYLDGDHQGTSTVQLSGACLVQQRQAEAEDGGGPAYTQHVESSTAHAVLHVVVDGATTGENRRLAGDGRYQICIPPRATATPVDRVSLFQRARQAFQMQRAAVRMVPLASHLEPSHADGSQASSFPTPPTRDSVCRRPSVRQLYVRAGLQRQRHYVGCVGRPGHHSSAQQRSTRPSSSGRIPRNAHQHDGSNANILGPRQDTSRAAQPCAPTVATSHEPRQAQAAGEASCPIRRQGDFTVFGMPPSEVANALSVQRDCDPQVLERMGLPISDSARRPALVVQPGTDGNRRVVAATHPLASQATAGARALHGRLRLPLGWRSGATATRGGVDDSAFGVGTPTAQSPKTGCTRSLRHSRVSQAHWRQGAASCPALARDVRERFAGATRSIVLRQSERGGNCELGSVSVHGTGTGSAPTVALLHRAQHLAPRSVHQHVDQSFRRSLSVGRRDRLDAEASTVRTGVRSLWSMRRRSLRVSSNEAATAIRDEVPPPGRSTHGCVLTGLVTIPEVLDNATTGTNTSRASVSLRVAGNGGDRGHSTLARNLLVPDTGSNQQRHYGVTKRHRSMPAPSSRGGPNGGITHARNLSQSLLVTDGVSGATAAAVRSSQAVTTTHRHPRSLDRLSDRERGNGLSANITTNQMAQPLLAPGITHAVTEIVAGDRTDGTSGASTNEVPGCSVAAMAQKALLARHTRSHGVGVTLDDSALSTTALDEHAAQLFWDYSILSSTRRRYERSLSRLFGSGQHFAFPFTIDSTLRVIAWCDKQNFTPDTMSSYLSAIARAHQECGLTSPTNSYVVKQVKAAYFKRHNELRASGERSGTAARARPVQPAVIEAWLVHARSLMDSDERVAALATLLTAYFLALRPDTVVRITPSDWRFFETHSEVQIAREKNTHLYKDPRGCVVRATAQQSRWLAIVHQAIDRHRARGRSEAVPIFAGTVRRLGGISHDATEFNDDGLPRRVAITDSEATSLKSQLNEHIKSFVEAVVPHVAPQLLALSSTVGFHDSVTVSSLRPSSVSAAQRAGYTASELQTAVNWVAEEMVPLYLRCGVNVPPPIVADELAFVYGFRPRTARNLPLLSTRQHDDAEAAVGSSSATSL